MPYLLPLSVISPGTGVDKAGASEYVLMLVVGDVGTTDFIHAANFHDYRWIISAAERQPIIIGGQVQISDRGVMVVTQFYAVLVSGQADCKCAGVIR